MASPRTRLRLVIIGIFLIAVSLVLLWRSAYVSLGEESRARANIELMTRTPLNLSKLEAQTKLIDDVSHHIEDYSLKDIADLLHHVANLAAFSNREIEAQSEAWIKIKTSASVDAKAYQELQRNLAVTNRLQAEEINRLRVVLSKAQDRAPVYYFMSFFWTFLVGVVIALITEYVVKALAPKARRFLVNFSENRNRSKSRRSRVGDSS